MSIRSKVDRLEEALIKLAQSEERLHKEFLEFKEEMRKQREEDRRKFEEFRQEMKEFKDEMRAFKDEMNKKWGWVINKLGILVEDLFYPSFPEVIKKHFGVELTERYMRVRKNVKGESIEIDVLGVGDDKVFVLEVKASPDLEEYIYKFKSKLDRFFEFFPEYRRYRLVPIYGGWNMKESTVKKLSELGIYAMVVKGDILEIVNVDDVRGDSHGKFQNR